jgi:hypothetical protein
MTDLTLGDIKNYLKTAREAPGNQQGLALCQDNVIRTTHTIQDVDDFLLAEAEKSSKYNTSSTTKDNFLELYNEQYSRNMEAFVGILIIGAILAKMMFYPTKV